MAPRIGVTLATIVAGLTGFVTGRLTGDAHAAAPDAKPMVIKFAAPTRISITAQIEEVRTGRSGTWEALPVAPATLAQPIHVSTDAHTLVVLTERTLFIMGQTGARHRAFWHDSRPVSDPHSPPPDLALQFVPGTVDITVG